MLERRLAHDGADLREEFLGGKTVGSTVRAWAAARRRRGTGVVVVATQLPRRQRSRQQLPVLPARICAIISEMAAPGPELRVFRIEPPLHAAEAPRPKLAHVCALQSIDVEVRQTKGGTAQLGL